MATGKVKWYDATKGFGFILAETGEDIFIHRTGLDRSIYSLDEGQEVEFDTKEGDKGTVAVNLKLA